MTLPVAIAMVAGSAVLGIAAPRLVVAMLMPSLEASDKARAKNYRGNTVVYGLGVVWLVWAACATAGGVVASTLTDGDTILVLLTVAGPLALVAFALGVIDDAYGTGDTRGFKGHVKALLRARLTTGGLKLLGMGVACLAASLVVSDVTPWGGSGVFAGLAALVLCAGAAIALTSNFVNLMDLRPGRALKAYLLLATAGLVSVALGFVPSAPADGRPSTSSIVGVACLALFLAGPVFGVWRDDLHERGMLGDAGANPMGAVAGLLIVVGLPAWALLAYLALMLALNLASERYSYSRIIESSALLTRLDMLGRPSEAARGESGSQHNAMRE